MSQSSDVDAATRDAWAEATRDAIWAARSGDAVALLAALDRVSELAPPLPLVPRAALERVEAERDAANAKVIAQHRRIVELERDGRRLYSQVWTVRDAKAKVEADNARLAERCSTLTDAARRVLDAPQGHGDHKPEWGHGCARCDALAALRSVLAASDTPEATQ